MYDAIPISAAQRRQALQAHAQAIGINDAYVSHLVDAFYARVREHPVLAPIFAEAIGDHWTLHLSRMKDFWASVAYNAGRYSGQPVPVHKALKRLEPHHFDIWLGLFRETLDDTAPTPAAAQHFLTRAERIAESLKLALFPQPLHT